MEPSNLRPSSTWQLQQAKAQLSAVVRQAETRGPQVISVRGKPVVVVLSQADYRKLQVHANKPRFAELMHASPLMGLELNVTRLSSVTRHIAMEE